MSNDQNPKSARSHLWIFDVFRRLNLELGSGPNFLGGHVSEGTRSDRSHTPSFTVPQDEAGTNYMILDSDK